MGKAIRAAFPKRKNALKKKADSIQNPKNTSKHSKFNLKRKYEDDTNEHVKSKKSKSEVDELDYNEGNNRIKSPDTSENIQDLFHTDQLKNSNEYSTKTDWFFHVLDEICLEGLDGITFQALWLRLKNVFNHPLLIEGREEIVWKLIKSCKQLQYFILPTARQKLTVYNRNDHYCPETGLTLEPETNPEIVYTFSFINSGGIRGSCPTFNERINKTNSVLKLNYEEAKNEFGDSLVIVASQRMRENAIYGQISDPNVELVDNEFGFLEKVGRSRYLGEVTQGNYSILTIYNNSQTVFHIRNALEHKKMLKKQFFMLRNIKSGQNKTGKLLHLPRFFQVQKTKVMLLVEGVVELLRTKPEFCMELGEFKKYFPRSTGIMKIAKSPEFRKHVKTNVFKPYRYFYPNAPRSEWKRKANNKEKVLRFLQLIDPTINVVASWDIPNDNEPNSDDECLDDEETGSKMATADFLKEVFMVVFERGKEGFTFPEVQKKIQMDYYTIRTALKKLQAKNVLDTTRSERGKQKQIIYFARCYHSKNPPTPLTQPMKLPQNILENILKVQKNSTFNSSSLVKKPSLELEFSGPKMLKIVNNSPFICNAFIQKLNTVQLSECLESKINIDISKLRRIELSNFEIPTKIYEIQTDSNGAIKHCKNVEEENVIITYSHKDLSMKLALLKALIHKENVPISKLLSGKSEEESPLIDLESISEERLISQRLSMDCLLGTSLRCIFKETTNEGFQVTILVSTPPEKNLKREKNSAYICYDKNTTALTLFRLNSLLKLLDEKGILSELYNLQKKLHTMQTEQKEFSENGKVDKNTLHRLLLRLLNEGYLKILKVQVSSEIKSKVQWFVMEPEMDNLNNIVEAAKQQLIVKLSLSLTQKKWMEIVEKPTKLNQSNQVSPFQISNINELEKIAPKHRINFKLNQSFGKRLGCRPKFIKLKIFHELLFYLIYDYSAKDELSFHDFKNISKHFKEGERIPPVFRKEIDWRMFIPPLNNQWELGNGWGLLCNIILHIPLSVWVKIILISVEIPELVTFLEHPVKRHFLIKDIPQDFRYALMYRRKYVFSFIELCQRLCFIGLLQMGPQNHHIRDHCFIFLNRKASILDTSSSEPGYQKISPGKYEEIKFEFNSKTDVEDYWCQLWTICVKTQLGQRSFKSNNDVDEDPMFKLADTLEAKGATQVYDEDIGEIPGDKLGAGGLDSSLWSHLKRNWSRQSKTQLKSEKIVNDTRTSKISKIKKVQFRQLKDGKHFSGLFSKSKSKIKSLSKAQKLKLKKKRELKRKLQLLSDEKNLDNHTLFRIVWTWEEDVFLTICKAVSTFFTGNPKIHFVPSDVIRDVIHNFLPISRDKSTNSFLKRHKVNMDKQPTLRRIIEHSNNLMNIMKISKHLSPIIYKNMSRNLSLTEKIVVYFNVISYVYKHLNEISEMLQGNSYSSDYLAENNIETFAPILVTKKRNTQTFYGINSSEALQKEILKSVIMSCLNNSKSDTFYQLFKICSRYPDFMIRSSVISLKISGAITVFKLKKGSVLPTKRSYPYKFSPNYIHMKKSTISTAAIYDTFKNFLELKNFASQSDQSTYISRLFCRNEVASIWNSFQLEFIIPETSYVLNPNVGDKESIILELAEYYQEFLHKKSEIREEIHVANNEIQWKSTEKKVKLEVIRGNISRLFTNIPFLCNQKISEYFTKFTETNDENEFNECLESFLASMKIILLNLLGSDENCVRKLEMYISKYSRPQNVDSYSKELNFKIFKVAFVIRLFLRNNNTANIKECFESNFVENEHEKLEEILETWLNKTKINVTVQSEKLNRNIQESELYQSFFKYNKRRVDNPKIMSLEHNFSEKIPEINEIMEEMMEVNDGKRRIPHITDLACMISRDDSSRNERVNELLKTYFITQYPELEQFSSSYPTEKCDKLIGDTEKIQLKNRIKKSFFNEFPENDDNFLYSKISQLGGDISDVNVVEEIINFVYKTGILGASAEKLKSNFELKTYNLSMIQIIQLLLSNSIIKCVGIDKFIFIHHEFSSSWCIETFQLTETENSLIEKINTSKDVSKLDQTDRVKKSVFLMPWIGIDGILNEDLLDEWLTIVFSYCLENPNVTLPRIFQKFQHVKPTDLVYLLEILQEIKSLKILVYETVPITIFSNRKSVISRDANILDNFEEMFVEVHSFSITSFGCYFHKISKD